MDEDAVPDVRRVQRDERVIVDRSVPAEVGLEEVRPFLERDGERLERDAGRQRLERRPLRMEAPVHEDDLGAASAP